MSKGMTIIEMLVVIALLALGGVLIKLRADQIEIQNKKEETRLDLKEIKKGIEELYEDTGVGPGHVSRQPCVRYPEMFLDNCSAGLTCTDGAFPNWNGPYLEEIPKDPWGNRYYFDADYVCQKETSGCESVPNTTKVRAIISGGPDENFKTTHNNVVEIICR